MPCLSIGTTQRNRHSPLIWGSPPLKYKKFYFAKKKKSWQNKNIKDWRKRHKDHFTCSITASHSFPIKSILYFPSYTLFPQHPNFPDNPIWNNNFIHKLRIYNEKIVSQIDWFIFQHWVSQLHSTWSFQPCCFYLLFNLQNSLPCIRLPWYLLSYFMQFTWTHKV